MKRLILLVIAVVVAGAAGLAAYYRNADSTPGLTTAAVTRGAVVERVQATGTLQAVTTVAVGSQVSGTISSLHADFNTRVRKAQSRGEHLSRTVQTGFDDRTGEAMYEQQEMPAESMPIPGVWLEVQTRGGRLPEGQEWRSMGPKGIWSR